MNSRLCISAPKLRTQHCIGSNEHIDRGWNRLRPRFAGRGQCRLRVIRDGLTPCQSLPVHPDQRTSDAPASMSQTCQNRPWAIAAKQQPTPSPRWQRGMVTPGVLAILRLMTSSTFAQFLP